ncbi:MAG: homoserine dehydrogenase [Anaerolineaceae bacterium]|nr:homoserine dehydrogenase [Anaerolineaceae bacterium]
MKQCRIAMIGFGNVGAGIIGILKEQEEYYQKVFNLQFKVVAINTKSRGSAYDPSGLSLDELLEAGSGSLNNIPALENGWSVDKVIEEGEYDALVEISYTNLETGLPAVDYVRKALKRGKHVVTANKGPIALFYSELVELAEENQACIGYEGTVMSGTPAVALGEELLSGAVITGVQGILNGTTNFILTQMEKGYSYERALAEAQAQGYAEADPAGDVEGHDAAGKVVILANILFGAKLSLEDVNCEGITGITLQDTQDAVKENCCWKLIGNIEFDGEKVKASVAPEKIPNSHPLASVFGATNAITYTTKLLGEVTLIGAGAGGMETGYALINDLLGIYR